MQTFILVMVLATSSSTQSGAASITQEFSTTEKCMAAGNALAAATVQRGNFVLAWGCFAK